MRKGKREGINQKLFGKLQVRNKAECLYIFGWLFCVVYTQKGALMCQLILCSTIPYVLVSIPTHSFNHCHANKLDKMQDTNRLQHLSYSHIPPPRSL